MRRDPSAADVQAGQLYQANQAGEARYRTLFELAHDVILRADRQGKILGINHRAELLTGYTRGELRQMNVFEHLIIPEDRSIIREVLQKTFDGQDSEYEVRWRTKTGTIIHLDGATVPWRSASGEIISTLCTLRDVTRQKRAQQALRESEELYRTILGNISDAVFITDLDGAFSFICPNVAVIFGYGPAEVQQMTIQ